MNTIWQHILRQRFIYFVFPAALLLAYVMILITNALTGRESTDDVGSVVGYFYAAIPFVLAMALTVCFKTHVDATRPAKIDGAPEVTSNMELLISRAYGVALLWLFLHFLHV